jgi:hypothetical protein
MPNNIHYSIKTKMDTQNNDNPLQERLTHIMVDGALIPTEQYNRNIIQEHELRCVKELIADRKQRRDKQCDEIKINNAVNNEKLNIVWNNMKYFSYASIVIMIVIFAMTCILFVKYEYLSLGYKCWLISITLVHVINIINDVFLAKCKNIHEYKLFEKKYLWLSYIIMPLMAISMLSNGIITFVALFSTQENSGYITVLAIFNWILQTLHFSVLDDVDDKYRKYPIRNFPIDVDEHKIDIPNNDI